MSANFKYTLLKNVRPYEKYMPQLTKPVLRCLIQVSVHYIESAKCTPEFLDLALCKLTNSGCEIPDNFCELFASILQIMQIYLRTPKGMVKDEELRDCLRELKFKEEYIDDISKVLHNHRDTLTRNFYEAKCLRSPPKRLQWRINISLSDSDMAQYTQPTIIIRFQMNNGDFRILELTLAMFHRLRYNIAVLLKEMQSLESRAVMKKF